MYSIHMYIITYIYTRELGYGVLSLWAVWACQGKTAAENKTKKHHNDSHSPS